MRLISLPVTLLSAVFVPFTLADSAGLEPPQLQGVIQRANALLSAGQFTDAVRAYTEALELAPSDYLLYFKRATAYLSVNRHSPALDDFEAVLRLTNGSFDGALIAKAKIYAKEGRWTESRDTLKEYSKKVAGDRAAGDLVCISLVLHCRGYCGTCYAVNAFSSFSATNRFRPRPRPSRAGWLSFTYTDTIQQMFAVSEGEVATKKAANAERAGKWDACVEAATAALQTASYSFTLRQQRADCALAGGDLEQAVADLTRLTHLGVSSTSQLLRISSLSYYLMEPSAQGLATVKQCLHFDPDSKPCKAAHRQIKGLDKIFAQLEKAGENHREVIKLVTQDGTGLAAKFDSALEGAMAAMDPPLPTSIVPTKISVRRTGIYRAACHAFVSNQQTMTGNKWCKTLLTMDSNAQDALVNEGEMAMKKEEWEDAVRFFDRAFEASGRSSQDIHQRLQKAQQILKQSKKKDYYKVLEVARDADLKTIKKAYRKKAITAHPDKGGSEQKMATVNEAYEVLSNDGAYLACLVFTMVILT